MTIKLNAVAAATAMILGTLSTAANADLLITEYVEGGSNNKVVELSNVGDSVLDLNANTYKLSLYSNGEKVPKNVETLTGTLAPGKSLVFHNSGAKDDFKVGKESKVTWFSGDDALVLTKDDAVIDSIGKVGEKVKWSDGDFATVDKTLRRKTSVTEGDTDITDKYPGTSKDQWAVLPKDTSDGLGCPGESACGSAATPGILLITEYIEGGSNNKAIEVSNVGGSALDLNANTYKLSLYSNGETVPKNVETLTGTLAPGKSLVFHNSGAKVDFKVGKESKVTWFSGDDALVLTKDDAVIDSIGKVGEQLKWSDGDFATVDKTLRRKASVTGGDTDISDQYPGNSKDQWLVLPKDTADGLGCAGESACSGSVTPDPDPTPDPGTVNCSNCDITAIKDLPAYDENVYYDSVLSSSFDSPEELKNALSAVISKGHIQLTYNEVWNVVALSDEDPANSDNVITLYSGTSIAKNKNNQNQPGDDKWDREHVWPKSHGFPTKDYHWGYTDAHHLRPAMRAVNGARSNNDFGICSDTGVEQTDKGAPGNYLDTNIDCWEPRDEVKGDVARMIMYMDTRYQGTDTATTHMPDLQISKTLTTPAQDDDPLIGTLCDLYQWSQEDEVSDAEIRRNNEVYKYQGNRNPYVDRPELVQEVYGAACGDDPTPTLVVEGEIAAPESVTEGAAFKLDASALTAGEDKTLTFKWEQTTGEEKTEVGTDAVLSLTAPMVKADTTLNFTLTISDGSLETTKAVSVPVTNVPLTLNVSFDGNTKLTEGDSTSITAVITDAPEGLTYSWKQVSGDAAKFTATGLKLDVTSPQVNINQALVFELTASNDDDSFKTTVSIDVQNTEEAGWVKPDGAGSFGGFIALLLPLMWRRRRA